MTRLAATTCLAVVLYVAGIVVANWDDIAKSYEYEFGPTVAAGSLASLVLLAQLAGAVQAIRGKPLVAKRLAEGNIALLAVIYLLAALVSASSPGLSHFTSAWSGAWFFRQFGLINFLPFLFLSQWVFASRAAGLPSERLWKGVGAGALMLCCTLGVLAVRMTLDNGPLFDDSGREPAPERVAYAGAAVFFGIGAAVHLIAIWRVLAGSSRPAAYWCLAMGVTCLVSGLYLVGQKDAAAPLPFPWPQVAATLYIGWEEWAPYLPLVSYMTVAVAGVALLFITRLEEDHKIFVETPLG